MASKQTKKRNRTVYNAVFKTHLSAPRAASMRKRRLRRTNSLRMSASPSRSDRSSGFAASSLNHEVHELGGRSASLMSAGAAEAVGSTSSRHVWQQSLYGMEAMRAGIRTATQLAVGGEYQSLITTNQSQPDAQRQRGVVSPPQISHPQSPRSQIFRSCACSGCDFKRTGLTLSKQI